ncbi:MAG: hypothetical protein EZS28_035162 [Streblomastix strix]|uniref:Uncharacterized protein n=1 Tax=Streblomastix strix TaxID=222440 RepID=A0A5J4UGV9_9EUKA|nr:MAG: hypothetical protein EZS28_035162 [Streblomastix strix]
MMAKKTPNDQDSNQEKNTHHNNENQSPQLREDGRLSGMFVPDRLTSKIDNWERINGSSFIKMGATPNWLSIEALQELEQIQTYKEFHGTTVQMLEYQKQLEKEIKDGVVIRTDNVRVFNPTLELLFHETLYTSEFTPTLIELLLQTSQMQPQFQ